MPENTKTITLMLNPRARPAKLSLRIGGLPQLLAGRRRDFLISEVAPYADKLCPLAASGALMAYSGDLVALSAEDLMATLGGKASPAPKKAEEPKPEPEEPAVEEATEPEPEPEPEEAVDASDSPKAKASKARSKKGKG